MALQKSFRMTRQKKVILEELSHLKSHPSAYEVYEAVRKRLPKISMGTVYRNLQRLAETGTVKSLQPSSSQRRYDENPNDHYHVRCQKCGCLVDVWLEPLKGMEKKVSQMTRFSIEGHFLEFYGVCPCCRSAESKSGSGGKTTKPVSRGNS